jgi:hypothetical protein
MRSLARFRLKSLALAAVALVVPLALAPAADASTKARNAPSVRIKLPSPGNYTLARVSLKLKGTRRHPLAKRIAFKARSRKRVTIKLRIKKKSALPSSVVVLGRVRKVKRKRRSARYALYVTVFNRRSRASSVRGAALGGPSLTLTTSRPDLTTARLDASLVDGYGVQKCFGDDRSPPGTTSSPPLVIAGSTGLSGGASAVLFNTAFQSSCPNVRIPPKRLDPPLLNSFLGADQGGGGNQLPVIQSFSAVFGTQCSTCTLYTVTASDPDGKIAGYSWSKVTPPGGTPSDTNCGRFVVNEPEQNQAYWDHPNSGSSPCNHATGEHPGYITVVVTDDKGGQAQFTDTKGSADYKYP